MNQIKKQILALAIEAGQIMRDFRHHRNFNTRCKPDQSLVTDADLKIQEFLDLALIKELPDSVILGEESFSDLSLKNAAKSRHTWIIDPIDGTQCFTSENCFDYGIAITLLENQYPVFSVFYAPELNLDNTGHSLFIADKENPGAFLNSMPVFCQQPQSLGKLEYLLLSGKLPHAPAETILYERMQQSSRGHKMASIAAFCRLAASNHYENSCRFITFREPKIWDLITGAHILEMAGGNIVTTSGKDLFPIDYSKIRQDCGNPRYQTVFAFPKSVRKEIDEILMPR